MICPTKKCTSFFMKASRIFIDEIRPYSGPAGRNGRACHYECPDCGGPTKINKVTKLVTTGGRRLKITCKDQDGCMWSGQLWEGPIPGLDWRAKTHLDWRLKQ